MRHLVLGMVLVATLAGCGGSDPEEDGSRRPTSPSAEERPASDEFVRKLDALCKDANPELADISTALTKARDAARAGRVSPPRTFRAFATLLRRASVTPRRLQTRLRAIEAPRGERAFHDALVDSLEQGASNLRQQVSAAEAQDAARLRDLSVNGSLINAKQKGLIKGHGRFRFCGRG